MANGFTDFLRPVVGPDMMAANAPAPLQFPTVTPNNHAGAMKGVLGALSAATQQRKKIAASAETDSPLRGFPANDNQAEGINNAFA